MNNLNKHVTVHAFSMKYHSLFMQVGFCRWNAAIFANKDLKNDQKFKYSLIEKYNCGLVN